MKRIWILLFAIVTIIGVHLEPAKAANAETLVIHYKRIDNEYDGWFLWLWNDGSDVDEAHYFNGSDSYGVTATIDIASEYGSIPSLGILIRDEAWNKDYGVDRFIDLTNPNQNGEVHVYFLQGEGFFGYVPEDLPGCDRNNLDPYLCAPLPPTGLIDVYFDSNLNVHFLASESISSNDITIYKNDTVEPFNGFSSGSSGTLNMINNVDVSKPYFMEINMDGELKKTVIRVLADYDSTRFNQAYNYDGELGFSYTNTATTFKVWAPVSSAVSLSLYTKGHASNMRNDGVDTPYEVIQMEYVEKGVWQVTVDGDLHGVYYTFNVTNSGTQVRDIQDPYGETFGLNGARSMVIDMERVNPEGWDLDKGVDGYTNPNDAIIYELHVRDLTSQESWGGPEEYRGLYMGFTVEGTSFTNPQSNVTVSTGLDHLVELGITHVHLLPTYDADWNDERDFQFNWGYNPQHYNSPEGGYSTDPYDGSVRVNEYKQMVMALHNNGINVINDVVYNHTGPGAYYSFNRIVPNYFYRFDSNGNWSNGSGVGNETASERYMVSKFIVDSIEYWATEYHIDGFRFDLMSIHDYDTMNKLSQKAEEIDPDIFVYGEPWGGGQIALDWNQQAGKNNLWRMPLVGAFNDNLRNAIKGSPDGNDGGYVTNSQGVFTVLDGLEGSFDYGDWSHSASTQVINYVTAHDNLTLYDKLKLANGSSVYTKEIDYQARLSNSIVMFSQGVPFLHAGVDFLRTKGGDHNSYEAPDNVNQLNWVRKSIYVDSFEYYKGIIAIRKEYDSFKMQYDSDIDSNLINLNPDGYGMIGIRLQKNNEDILIYFNGGAYSNDVSLPSGAWTLLADRDEAGLEGMGTYATRYPIEKAETLVFVKGNSEDVIPSPLHAPEITNKVSIAFEGVSYRVTSTTKIAAYSVDNGDFIEVDETNTFVYVSGLALGMHDIRIKDIYGGISEPFTVTIMVNPNAEKTCEEDPNQDKCEEEPIDCEEGFEKIGEECKPITEPDPVVCDEGFELIDNECEKIIEDTGCFGFVGSVGLVLTGMIAGTALFIKRKYF